jgi:nucleotide-binding universal stress UspA family protein
VERLFEEAGAPIDTRVIFDKEPDDYIKEQVKEEEFDLVILGCKGEHSTIKRVIGTVPEKVLNDVACDVLIAR